jgi:pyruvate dehydrogenase E2 component (dihydrolipoamide acetyltransferase)
MYGIRDFSAVINPPQTSILAVGMGEQRAIAKNGKPAVATLMTVTLSADHRAVDGALGAELVRAFKEYVEHPVEMLA